MATTTPLRVCEKIVSKSGVTTVLQLSDLHLRCDTLLNGALGQGSFMYDLERSLRTQMEREKFDLVVVTGDLIDASEFWSSSWEAAMTLAGEAVRKVCEIVEVEPEQGLLVIPGNHDLRQRGIWPKPKLERYFRQEFGAYFAHSYYPALRLLVACFDSNEQVWPGLLDLAEGMAATKQCDEVRDAIEALGPAHRENAKHAFRLALIHHHLMAIPADDFAPGTRIIGAPPLMMLQNAGSFLQRLLKERYRLVLHGHLHAHGYWLPQTFFDNDDSPRWLELISCGWAGLLGVNNVRTFNVVKIQGAGLVESRRVEFQAGALEPRPIKQEMAGYNLVRTRAWDDREHPPGAVVCDTHSQRCDVILPEGDVVDTEVIRGLRGDGGEVAEMLIYKEALGLTLVDFSAEYLGADRRPIPFQRFVQVGQVPRIGFKLTFDPPLGNDKVDILLRSTVFGAIASSKEDQTYAKVEVRNKGKEEIYTTINRACGRLVVNVRFFSDATDLVPKRVSLRIYDPSWRLAPHEARSDHLTWDFWSSDRESKTVFELPSVPEASLSVYRPQLGHSYALEWDLPEFEPIEERASLMVERDRLLRLEGDPRALAAAQAFLGALRRCVQAHASLAGDADPSLGVYLYAFDRAESNMVRKEQDTFPGDPFPRRIAYGRDLIGTAFRSWFPASFDRVEPHGRLPLFDQMPEDVESLLAAPLWRSKRVEQVEGDPTTSEPIDGAPVGVVGIASRRDGSPLGQILAHEGPTTALNQQIATLWRTCQVEAGWVAPEGA